jgi:hypothetical protein
VDGPLLNLDDQATFAGLSDVGNKVARQFGIVFQIGEKLQKLYRKWCSVVGREAW